MVMAAVGGGIYIDRDSTISGFSSHLYSILPFLIRVVLGLYVLYIRMPHNMGGRKRDGGGGRKKEN